VINWPFILAFVINVWKFCKKLFFEKVQKNVQKLAEPKSVFSSYSHPLGPKEHSEGWGSSDFWIKGKITAPYCTHTKHWRCFWIIRKVKSLFIFSDLHTAIRLLNPMHVFSNRCIFWRLLTWLLHARILQLCLLQVILQLCLTRKYYSYIYFFIL